MDEMGDRPWERPGEVRRDADPHRGHLLRVLANASVVCVLVSLCSLFPSVVGLAVGLAALVMAWRDLGKMRAGVIDVRGRKVTQKALGDALFAVTRSRGKRVPFSLLEPLQGDEGLVAALLAGELLGAALLGL